MRPHIVSGDKLFINVDHNLADCSTRLNRKVSIQDRLERESLWVQQGS